MIQRIGFSDGLARQLQGIGGIGEALNQKKQLDNQTARTTADVAQMGAELPGIQADAGMKQQKFQDALKQDRLLANVTGLQKDRMGLPENVRKDGPSDAELLLWSQLQGKPIDEVRAGVSKSTGEATQVGLDNDAKRQTFDYNANLQPEIIKGKKLDNAQTAQTIDQSGKLFGPKMADAKLQPGKTQAETDRIKAETDKTNMETAAGPKTPKTNANNLTEREKNQLSDFSVGTDLLSELAGKFSSDISGKNAVQQAGNWAADAAESIPFVGGKIAPETRTFNDLRRITAETMLRAATGANAPEPEVKFYTALLPEAGMSNKEAQSKMDAFVSQMTAKAKGTANRLRLTGNEQEAQKIEGGIDDMVSKVSKIFDSTGQADTASQGAVKIKDDSEYDSLPSGTDFIDPNGVKRRKP
jgi:hypothetical protein